MLTKKSIQTSCPNGQCRCRADPFRWPILTMEASQPRAEAIAIDAGQIVAVGTKAEVMVEAGQD